MDRGRADEKPLLLMMQGSHPEKRSLMSGDSTGFTSAILLVRPVFPANEQCHSSTVFS